MRAQFVSLQYSETPHEWDLYVFFLTSLLDTHFDVPREFYPLRSTSSTHFEHLNLRWPLGENWAKEKTHRSAEYGTHVFFFFFACSWFVVNGASGGDPGTTLTALRRQKQTIGYKTVCCSSAARWNGGGSFPPLINTKIQVIFWYYLNLRTLFLTCTL